MNIFFVCDKSCNLNEAIVDGFLKLGRSGIDMAYSSTGFFVVWTLEYWEYQGFSENMVYA